MRSWRSAAVLRETVQVAEIAEGISRKVRKVREISIGNTLAAEASKNLFRRIARPSRGFADILSAKEFYN